MRDSDDQARLDERILDAARKVVQCRGRNEFTVREIVRLLRFDYPEFSEGAIRKSVISQCSRSAADSSMAGPGNFERMGNGLYRLGSPPAKRGSINTESKLGPRISAT